MLSALILHIMFQKTIDIRLSLYEFGSNLYEQDNKVEIPTEKNWNRDKIFLFVTSSIATVISIICYSSH